MTHKFSHKNRHEHVGAVLKRLLPPDHPALLDWAEIQSADLTGKEICILLGMIDYLNERGITEKDHSELRIKLLNLMKD